MRLNLSLTTANTTFCSKPTNYAKTDLDVYLEFNKKLDKIIKAIGGIEKRESIPNDVEKAKLKIKLLKKQTTDYENRTIEREKKLKQLEKYTKELNKIAVFSFQYKTPPQKSLISDSTKPLLTDALDIMSAYNKLSLKNQNVIIAINSNNKPKSNVLSLTTLKKSLNPLNKENWNYKKFNKEDAKLFPDLRTQIITKDFKNELNTQINIINKKIKTIITNLDIKKEANGFILYNHNTSAKLLTLETARARRVECQKTILKPNLDKNLSDPKVVVKKLNNDDYLSFKLTDNNILDKDSLNKTFEMNTGFKPILEKLYKENPLKVFVLPAIMNSKNGEIEGGVSFVNNPNEVILTSYNYKKRQNYTINEENFLAKVRGVKNFIPSVTTNSSDPARALAHEISHAISYKLNKQTNNEPISFIEGHRAIRQFSQHNDRNIKDLTKNNYISEDSKNNLKNIVEYESIAEDIRNAVTSDKIKASSVITGIFDQTKTGKSEYNKAINYIKDCLFNDQKPTKALTDNLSL